MVVNLTTFLDTILIRVLCALIFFAQKDHFQIEYKMEILYNNSEQKRRNVQC